MDKLASALFYVSPRSGIQCRLRITRCQICADLIPSPGRWLTPIQHDRRGDPELPPSDADLQGKLPELAAPIPGEPQTRALIVKRV